MITDGVWIFTVKKILSIIIRVPIIPSFLGYFQIFFLFENIEINYIIKKSPL
jgi:hypothetical protein